MSEALGLIEVRTFSGSAVVSDIMAKAADVRLVNLELNDLYGGIIRVMGETSAVQAAIDAGQAAAERMKIAFVSEVIARPAPEGLPFNLSPARVSWLLGQPDPLYPDEETPMAQPHPALGFIECQGITACYEACDAMLKTADVQYIGKEKIGGGYVTVIISGDVGAVTTAVEAGEAAAKSVGGNFIASHVIARPHDELMRMMPKE